MRQGRSSLTAAVMAAVRAGLTDRDLLSDPYAHLFVRPPIRMLTRVVRTPARDLPALRELVANVAGRTQLFDQQVQVALEEGVRQIVILGAGYDSRSYRLPSENTRYVEVDSPATQELKRRRLQEAGISVEHVTFLPVDFTTDSLERRLRSVISVTQPTCFLWEGVVEYLSEEAVRKTLRDLRNLSASGSRLVFDLPHASTACAPVLDFLSRFLSGILGEPKGLALEPEALKPLLRDAGWQMLSMCEITDLYQRYLKRVLRRAPTPHNYYVVAIPDTDAPSVPRAS